MRSAIARSSADAFPVLSQVMRFDLLQLPPRVALANFYPFAPGEQVGPHWSQSTLFLVATKGTGEVRAGGQQFTLNSAMAAHVPWAMPVHYAAARQRPFVLIGVHLLFAPWSADGAEIPRHTLSQPEDVTARERAPHAQPYAEPFAVKIPAASSLIATATAMAATFNDPDDADREARLRMHGLAFVLEFAEIGRRQNLLRSHPHADRISGLLAWLDESYRQPLSRGDLSRRAGMSGTTLNAAFHAVTGRSPIEYVIDLRLAEARRLLSSGSAPIAEIARAVGIADVAHFSKLFRKRHGIPPLRYRQNRRI
jgi:iron complex transport system substrate-binding protein